MNRNCQILVTGLSLALLSFNINAQWLESKGQARILNNNIEIARNNAVQNALRQSLIVAGARVSSIQEISNGLLTSDRFEVRSQGSVRDIQLLNERHKNCYITVTIRADIVREFEQCSGTKLTKTLVLTEFPLSARSQAATGGIFELGKYTAQQLHRQINSLNGVTRITQLLPLQQQWQQQLQPMASSPFITLANRSNAQYVLTAQITDISMFQANTKWLGFVTESPLRQFSLNVFIYDGSNGEQVWNKQYQTQAVWIYQRQTQVDVSTSAFWQSAYGAAINDQLIQLTDDINDKLRCEAISGRIVKATKDQFTINLGSEHGIKAGDQLMVIHQGSFIDLDGTRHQTQQISDAKLKVIQLGRYNLVAEPVDVALAGGIQIRDQIVKE